MTLATLADDPSLGLPLPDDLILWRRIPKDKVVRCSDADGITKSRPSSDCFSDNLRDGSSMSVFDSKLSLGLESILEGHEGFGVVALTVGQVRAEGMTVVRTKDGGSGHCEVVGKKTSGARSRLAKAAVWVIEPALSS